MHHFPLPLYHTNPPQKPHSSTSISWFPFHQNCCWIHLCIWIYISKYKKITCSVCIMLIYARFQVWQFSIIEPKCVLLPREDYFSYSWYSLAAYSPLCEIVSPAWLPKHALNKDNNKHFKVVTKNKPTETIQWLGNHCHCIWLIFFIHSVNLL